jgi:hypothetical protein
MTCLNDDFDITAFPCNLMQNLKNREIFKNRSHITNMLKIRGVNLKAKRKIIITANTPLFYIFGYVLQDKPWLSYEEIYGDN